MFSFPKFIHKSLFLTVICLCIHLILSSTFNQSSSLHKQIISDSCSSSSPLSPLSSQPSSTSSKTKHNVQFNSSIEPDLYIITFKNRLKWTTRKTYIDKYVLGQLDNDDFFAIVDRNEFFKQHPSDFDLIKLKSKNAQQILSHLNTHPAIKRISPEKKLTKLLINDNKPDNQPDNQTECLDANDFNGRKLNYNTRNNYEEPSYSNSRRLFKAIPRQITSILHADHLWAQGITGAGIKVAIFDTGLPKNHPHFKKVKERTNWTNEKTLDDKLGHGTFVAGIIASSKECLGFAPDAELHIYRVFTSNQVSYTSWFLDAFNYAIIKKINVLNLSIGGPDFEDHPFVEKVWELTANNIIMISAIGNDGPVYGGLSNPADASDVIGVGGINFDDQIAKFSSRGMTTWEIDFGGYGRVKPDIVTYGSEVRGSNIKKGCKKSSGTSVASPVVAGAVALIMSGVLHLGDLINPASIKQSLMASARRLPNVPIFEQGAGKLDLIRAYNVLKSYKPQATLFPSYVDFTECPYMWPYCSQPIYYGSMPVIVNVTVLNGMGVTGYILDKPKWYLYQQQSNINQYIDISIKYSKILWPWSGWMAVYIKATPEAMNFNGIVEGHINFTVQSPSLTGQDEMVKSDVKFFLKIKIIPTPPRNKRVLWDQYHSLRYPPNYFPRDNLRVSKDPLDWTCDHIHTNFKDLYDHLRNSGYYIEVLNYPITCFDAKEYGTLLIVDPEREFIDEEIVKLKKDYDQFALSVIVFADWYNATIMQKVQFFNENTRTLWKPETGGSNIPSINNLLKPWNISFGDLVFEGDFKLGSHDMYYASGSSITNFPSDGILIKRNINNQGKEMIDNNGKITKLKDVPILGLYSGEFTKKQNLHPPMRKNSEGRIAVYGDSSCLDSVHLQKDCFWMLEAFLQFTTTGTVPFIFQHSHQNSKDDSFTAIEDYDKVHVDTLFANRTSKEQINCLFLEWEKPIIMMNESLPANIYKSQKSILLNNLELSNNNILPDMIVNNLENEDINKLERNSFKQMLEYEGGSGGVKSQLDQDQVNSSILTFNNCVLLLSIVIIVYLLNNLFKCFNFRTLRRKFILLNFNFNFNFNNSANKKVKRRKLSTEVDNDWLLEETLTTNADNNISNL